MIVLAKRSIAIVATGNELVEGDVVNTNAAAIAQRLTQAGLLVSEHRTVADHQPTIVQTFKSLSAHHRIIITIGGLGPTCDDITRFAVAEFGDVDCKFDDACWQQLVERFEAHHLSVPSLNKQQCLFPPSATYLPNPHGSAAGFEWTVKGITFFVLPGPPKECLPMLDAHVMPRLDALSLAAPVHRYHALLMGVGEGQLAGQLEPIMENIAGVDLGYRVCFPYLEIKLQANSAEALISAKAAIWPHVSDFWVSDKKEMASTQLRQWLCDHDDVLSIDDQATQGHWQALLVTATTLPRLSFGDCHGDMRIQVIGLDAYWANDAVGSLVSIALSGQLKGHDFSCSTTFTMRGPSTLQAVLEWLCWQLLLTLREVMV